MQIRPFEDLIKPIEIDGETFCPIEEIAKLAIENYQQDGYLLDSLLIVPLDDDYSACSKFIDKSGYVTFVIIHKNFDVSINDVGNDDDDFEYPDLVHNLTKNQVQIVKNLIKWGFIEP